MITQVDVMVIQWYLSGYYMGLLWRGGGQIVIKGNGDGIDDSGAIGVKMSVVI